MNRLLPIALSGLLALGACGGDGSGPTVSEVEPGLSYSSAAEERHSYTPYASRSNVYLLARGDASTLVYIGGDLEPRESLRHIVTDNGIRYFMGASRDGVGVDRLENYETDLTTRDGDDRFGLYGDGSLPRPAAPELWTASLGPRRTSASCWPLPECMMILNDVLPPEFQLSVTDARTTSVAYSGEIFVSLESPDTIRVLCGAGAVACAVSQRNRIFGLHRFSRPTIFPTTSTCPNTPTHAR